MDLIAHGLAKKIREEGPLAQRMRPSELNSFSGQEHILAAGKPLRKMIESDKLVSMLFYGPPGTGKTTLARIIARSSKSAFTQLNAVASGVKDVRQVIEEGRESWSLHNQRTILFIDEIHRFNKAQQDVLLAAVEEGVLIFIGATTENPFFYIIKPLLSRCRLFTFAALNKEDVEKLLYNALGDETRGFGRCPVKASPEAISYLAEKADGDARVALNTLEMAVVIGENERNGIDLNLDAAAQAMEKRLLSYDRQGDSHYDHASALIKSIRGSDPDAALYWTARMLEGGEDPLFIARRLVISASEDIGNAEPQALLMAMAAAQAVQLIGMPEGRIVLAQAVTFLACSPKSNTSYLAIEEASRLVREEKEQAVPKHLKNSSYSSAKIPGHGEGYRYPHDYPGHYVIQDYLPSALLKKEFYRPTMQGYEKKFYEYLAGIKKIKGEEFSPGKE